MNKTENEEKSFRLNGAKMGFCDFLIMFDEASLQPHIARAFALMRESLGTVEPTTFDTFSVTIQCQSTQEVKHPYINKYALCQQDEESIDIISINLTSKILLKQCRVYFSTAGHIKPFINQIP